MSATVKFIGRLARYTAELMFLLCAVAVAQQANVIGPLSFTLGSTVITLGTTTTSIAGLSITAGGGNSVTTAGNIISQGNVSTNNGSSGTMRNIAATATVPTLLPNQGTTTAGIGGTSGTVSLITGGVNAFTVDTGQLLNLGTNSSVANGTATVVFTSLGPTGTACVVGDWFKVKDSGGNTRYLPLLSCV